jgi:hypothetical protein
MGTWFKRRKGGDTKMRRGKKESTKSSWRAQGVDNLSRSKEHGTWATRQQSITSNHGKQTNSTESFWGLYTALTLPSFTRRCVVVLPVVFWVLTPDTVHLLGAGQSCSFGYFDVRRLCCRLSVCVDCSFSIPR